MMWVFSAWGWLRRNTMALGAMIGGFVLLGFWVALSLARKQGARHARQQMEQANDKARGDMAGRIDTEAHERDRGADARDQRLRDAGLL